MPLLHIYRYPGSISNSLLNKIQSSFSSITSIETEYCFNVEALGESIPVEQYQKLLWLFTETFEPEGVREEKAFLESTGDNEYIVEVGPRMAFTTAWSSNCSSMCLACGIDTVGRIERSRRYKFTVNAPLTSDQLKALIGLVHDRMTECVYEVPLNSFDNGVQSENFKVIPLLEKGKAALEEINRVKGLGFDEWDLDFYTKMFTETLKRNPTDVELFDLGQSNSEHSRHWFFGGKMIIDGEEKAETLFQMVKSTLPKESNSVIAFHDNSSVSKDKPLTIVANITNFDNLRQFVALKWIH